MPTTTPAPPISSDLRRTDHAPEALAEALLDAIPLLVQTIRDAVRQTPDVEGMTLPQFKLLKLLALGACQPAELAEMACVSRPTVSVAVDGLERRALVERVRNVPGDRRAVLVRLTPAGQALYQSMRRRATGALTMVFAGAAPEERARMEQGLQGLLRVLTAAARPGDSDDDDQHVGHEIHQREEAHHA